MPPRIRYSIPRKPVVGRPIPATRTPLEILETQIAQPGAVETIRRARPDLVQADDLTVVETILQEARGGGAVASPAPQARPARPIIPPEPEQLAIPGTRRPPPADMTLSGLTQTTLDALRPPPRVYDPDPLALKPTGVPPVGPFPEPAPIPEVLLSRNSPERKAAVEADLAKLPSETELAVQAREMSGVRDMFPEVAGPQTVKAQREAAIRRELGGFSTEHFDDLSLRPVDELYDMAKQRLAPDEFARMRVEHDRLKAMSLDEEINQGIRVEDEIFNDLTHRIQTSKNVKAGPELDVDALLDQAGEPPDSPMRLAIRKLYHEGDPEEFAPQPGGRASRNVGFDYLDDSADPNDPAAWEVVRKRSRPTVSPLANPNPVKPKIVKSAFEYMPIEALPTGFHEKIDRSRFDTRAGEPAPFPLAVGNRAFTIGDIADVEPTAKSAVPAGGPPRAELRAGKRILEGEIVHIVPRDRAVASQQEIRAWAPSEGRLINDKEVRGPIPSAFNFPEQSQERVDAGTGVTRYDEYENRRTKKVTTKVKHERTLEAAPVVVLRLDDGRLVHVPGSALRPTTQLPRTRTQLTVDKGRAYLAQADQRSFDFETGRDRESRIESRIEDLASTIASPWKVIDPRANSQGRILVQLHDQKPIWINFDQAVEKGIIPPKTPMALRVEGHGPREIPEVGTESIPGGVTAKKFEGLIRPGDRVVYKGQEQEVAEVRPNPETKLVEILFKGGAVAGAGALAAGASDSSLPSDEELAQLQVSSAGFRLPNFLKPKPRDIPLPAAPRMERVRTAQDAPVETLDKRPLGLKTRESLVDESALLKEGARILDETENLYKGGKIDPEGNLAFLLQGIKEGGGIKAERAMERLARDLAPIQDAGLMEPFMRLVNYQGMENTWRLIPDKISRLKGMEAKAYAEGDDLQAQKWGESWRELDRRVKAKEIVPEKYTPEEIAAEKADLLAALPSQAQATLARGLENYLKLTEDVLKTAKAHGLVGEEWFEEYASRGGYIPMHRIMEAYDPERGARVRRPGGDYGEPTTSTRLHLAEENVINNELLGSPRIMEHPVRNIADYINGVMNEVQRNRGAKAVLDFYAIHGTHPALAKFKGLYQVKPIEGKPPTAKPFGKEYVSYLENGQPKWFEVDSQLAGALKAFDPDVTKTMFGKGFGAIRGWAQILSASANLPFIAVQGFKDPIGALISTNTRKYAGLKPMDGMTALQGFGNFMGAVLTNYTKALGKPVARALGGREGAFKFDDAVEGTMGAKLPFRGEFNRSPAKSRPLATFVSPAEKAGIDMSRGQQTLTQKANTGAMKIAQAVQDTLLTPIEEATKYTSYAALRKSGFGPVEATQQTRLFGGSPDWNQRGSLMSDQTAIGKAQDWVLFLNPALQGVARMLKAGKEHPASFGKAAMYGGAALALLHAHNSQFVDENGVREIDKIPDQTLLNNFVFILPEGMEDATGIPGLDPEVRSTGSRRYTTLKFPMAHELAFVLRPALIAMRVAEDKKGNYSAAQGLVDTVSPLLPGGVSMDVEKPLTVLDRITASLNPAVRYPLEVQSGRYSFTGVPIVGSRAADNSPEYQHTTRTHPAFVALGKSNLGKALGISPDYAQHFAQTFSGGTAETLAGLATPFLGREANPLAEVRSGVESGVQAPVVGPLLRRFAETGVADQTVMNDRERFYRAYNTVGTASADFSHLKGRNPEELQALISSNPELLIRDSLHTQMTSWRNILAQLDQQREIVQRSSNIPLEQKRSTLESLWNTERRLFEGINSALDAWVERGFIPK